MAYDYANVTACEILKKEAERKEVLCQEIEEFWKEDCYGDVEDFFGCSPMEYKLVTSSLRGLDIEELEAMHNACDIFPATALHLAMTAVQKNNFIPVGSEKI